MFSLLARIRQPLLLATGLAAAVGAPYVASNSGDVLETAWKQVTSRRSLTSSSGDETTALIEPEAAAELAGSANGARLEGAPVENFLEVFRFDITPAWVHRRWTRKTTSLPELHYHGIRVPLVTGTRPDDLAGSLTYYFGARGGLEMIAFRGHTGDPRRLIAMLTQAYGLRRQPPQELGELRYEVTWNRKPISRLVCRPRSTVKVTQPHTTYRVELTLQRPGAARFLDEA